jgi:hypothetical protein
VQFDLSESARTVVYQSPTSLVYDQFIDGIPCRNLILGPDFNFRQGAVSKRNPEQVLLPFTKNLFVGSFFAKNMKNALVLGMGVGVIPMALRTVNGPALDIDVVDISLEVMQIAVQFFGLGAGNVNAINMDAAIFVQQLSKKYDYICVDIWNDKGVPDFLLNGGFWDGLFEALNIGGVVSLNAPKLLHKEFCMLLAAYVPHFFSLAGDNTALFLQAGGEEIDLSDRACLDVYARIGVDVEKILGDALFIKGVRSA